MNPDYILSTNNHYTEKKNNNSSNHQGTGSGLLKYIWMYLLAKGGQLVRQITFMSMILASRQQLHL